MMNLPVHQPFRDWLFSEEPLESEQVRQLQEHLRGCESCRQQQTAWTGVSNLFQHSAPVSPLAGFANRWQARLVERQLELRLAGQRKLAWGLFAGSGLLALLLLSFLGWQVLAHFGSPAALWAQFAWLGLLLAGLLEQLAGVLYVVSRMLPPVNFWLLLLTTGLISLLSVLWLVVYQQLTMRRVAL